MEDIKRYEVYYSWDSMGSNMKKHEDISEIGDYYKVYDVESIVKSMQNTIDELENTKMDGNCSCSMKQMVIDAQFKKIEELQDNLLEMCEALVGKYRNDGKMLVKAEEYIKGSN